jgi:hypothetical protein
MNPTVFQISAAIIMLVASIAMIVWFESYRAAASTKRLTDMMKRRGLDPGIGANSDPRTEAIMKEVRQRCRKCQAEGVCERLLAWGVKGRNIFCPNRLIFRMLKKTAGHTG